MENKRPLPRFYTITGISLLKRIIMGSIGRFVLLVNPREKMPSYFVGRPFNPDSLIKTLKWTYFNEVVHLSLIFVSVALGYIIYLKGSMPGVIIMTLVTFLNIGLAMLQHLNRAKINRTISNLNSRTKRLPG